MMRSVKRHRRHSASAFSLIEMLMVMAIVSVLAAMAVPRFYSAAARQRLDAACFKLAEDLRYAARYARYHSEPVRVGFSEEFNRYMMDNVADLDHVADKFTVELDEEPYGVEIKTVSLSGSNPFITFNAWGYPKESAEIVLMLGGRSTTVQLEQKTGQVSVN